MSTRIRFRRDTAANWTSYNPTLTTGELGYETNTGKFKIGDNSTAWTSLAYSITAELSEGNLNDLKDVTISSAANGDFLRWNGTAWINDAVNLSTDTVGSFVESLVAGTGITLSNNSGEGATPTVAVTANTFEAYGAVSSHEADTTSVHGIADTSILVTTTGTQTLTNKTITSPGGLVKGDVGLGNVDNTSNTSERAATATLTNKTLTSPVINTPTGIVKGDVGLGNVDNTTDAGKPVSTVQQTALDLKANLASPTFTGTVTVPTPTNSTDAVTKAYADAVMQGLDIKDSVLVASTANIAIATALTNGSTIDGIVVATGDRVLLKNQTTAAQNGIYVVVASGAASRSTDANTSAKVTSGMYVFVSEGTVSADMGYVIATNDPITLDTTALSFTQFSGAGQITAGTGLSKSANTLSIDTATTADLSTAQTLTNKTLTSPVINTPTGIVKGDVGLSNVDNTLDTAKPVSSAQQTAIDAKANIASPTFTGTVTIPSGASISGFAPLASPEFTGTPTLPSGTSATTQTAADSTTKVATTAFVTNAISTGIATVDTLDDLTDVVITSAASGQFLKWNGSTWINDSVPIISNIDDITGVTITAAADKDFLMYNGTAWVDSPITLGTDTTGSYVTSLVAGTGVTLANNSGESATPTVTVDTTVIAPLASPTFTGVPAAPTAAAATNTTQVATTAFVRAEVAALVGTAGATLDTLGEIATALGNDVALSTTLTTSIGLKAPLASPTFTGTVTLPSGTVTSTMILDGTIVNADISTTAAIDQGKIADTTINAQVASYTLVLTDKNKLVEVSNASANTLTVPPNASVAFPIGSTLTILQTGAGQCTLTAGSGVTVNATPGLKMRTQYSSATLIKRATDTWVALGDLSA